MSSKKYLLFTLLVMAIGFWSSAVFAGGVIQEFRIDSDQQPPSPKRSSKAVNTDGYPYHTGVPPCKNKPPEDCKVGLECKNERQLINLYYDASNKRAVLSWKPLFHKGQRAVRYLIFRWSLINPTRQLLAAVEGDVMEFIDHSQRLDDTYFYEIVGIYRIGGDYISHQYPALELKQYPEEPPVLGMGCQIPSAPQLPNAALLLTLLLLIPFLRRK